MSALREHLTLLGAKETDYPTSPEKARLETFPNPRSDQKFVVTFHCTEFTSRCPLTNQPDFGDLEIIYAPNQKCLESKSLKLFLGSYRDTGAFWERLITDIAERLYAELEPRWIHVSGTMNVRGGIGMTVVTRIPVEDQD